MKRFRLGLVIEKTSSLPLYVIEVTRLCRMYLSRSWAQNPCPDCRPVALASIHRNCPWDISPVSAAIGADSARSATFLSAGRHPPHMFSLKKKNRFDKGAARWGDVGLEGTQRHLITNVHFSSVWVLEYSWYTSVIMTLSGWHCLIDTHVYPCDNTLLLLIKRDIVWPVSKIGDPFWPHRRGPLFI